MHLWKGVPVLVHLLAGLLPPDGEVLSHTASQVATVGGGLAADLVECLVGSLPVSTLHGKEGCETQSGWQTQDEVLGLSAKDRSHKRVGEEPSYRNVEDALCCQLLKLAHIELLHFNDFPLR